VIEFTGERVIPGEVNDDLWAEHLARYAFASRYAGRGRALDIGCGTGYGVAELARSGSFTAGVDPAADAIAYAHAHYPMANAYFLRASAQTLPFADRSFHLVTAFEVIEHLEDWHALLTESRRVLHPNGIFVVSTPNKLYYAESRVKDGPNPFHAHEFEFAGFRAALSELYPHVTTLLQNRLESLVFSPTDIPSQLPDARIDGPAGPPEYAHFFVAVCSVHIPVHPKSFLYVPRASNLLREREQHIRLLEDELVQAKQWLDGLIADHKTLFDAHAEQTHQLEEHNRWALKLEQDWRAGQERIARLQEELKTEQAAAALVASNYGRKVSELEQENRVKTEWALQTEQRLSGELADKCRELGEAVRLLDTAEATVIERTLWAQQLQQRLERAESQVRKIAASRWVKLGRLVGLGPRVEG
jgi:ubiquinone/menaquinone biosynthesis C-methylase UbiE